MADAESVKKRLLARRRDYPAIGLSSGAVLLNLACSGSPDYAFRTGGYYFYVGDSASGKTLVTWSTMAEAAHCPDFDKYRLVLNNAENGSWFDTAKLFGKKTLDRVEVTVSPTLDHFYDHLEGILKGGERVVYVLDSMDVLRPRSAHEKSQKMRKAVESGAKSTGTYGTDKARMNSERMPEINALLRDTGSILFVISQTRDNIGPGAMFNPKTRSGGNSLTFYAQLEMWTSVKERIKRDVRSKAVPVGILCKVVVKKNRLTGKVRTVTIPIYSSVGLDDLGSQVRYLVEWGHWAEDRKKIDAKEFDVVAKEEELVAAVEERGLEKALREITASVWREVDRDSEVKRKPRYE